MANTELGFEAWRKARLDKYEAELDSQGVEDWKRAEQARLQAQLTELDANCEAWKQVRIEERRTALEAEWLELVSPMLNVPESPCRDAQGGSTTKLCQRYPGCSRTGICHGLQ